MLSSSGMRFLVVISNRYSDRLSAINKIFREVEIDELFCALRRFYIYHNDISKQLLKHTYTFVELYGAHERHLTSINYEEKKDESTPAKFKSSCL